MITRIDIGAKPHGEPFAEATPVGLIGLAIGCAALTPIAFGMTMQPGTLRTAAMYCLLFGAGGQLVAGLLSFANHNLFGGTLFTAFTFNWLLNWWALDVLARGFVPDARIVLAAEVCFLVVFLAFTYGFGFYSSLLFLFLLDIDLLYVCRVLRGFSGSSVLDLPIAVFTVGLAAISLWLAFAMLINPVAGRPVFRLTGPLWTGRKAPGFDTSVRRAILAALYAHWREHAFQPMPVTELEQLTRASAGDRSLRPDLAYLAELGGVVVIADAREPGAVTHARLTARGVDFWEQVALGKQGFV